VDILISESTFGIRIHERRERREKNFQEYVHKIVKGGGKCLLPVFSAGRAEELLFILDEYWEQKVDELSHIPIYYTVSLIDKCRQIYETYIDMLSKKIRERFYKEEVIVSLCRPILSNTGISTT
jgi:cleavage and polyadenylation specificity factor subunit 3